MGYVANKPKSRRQRKPWDDKRKLQLFQAYKETADPTIRDEIFHEYRRLAVLCACKYADRGAEFDDLYQEACMGVVRAIERFDPERGVEFATYATYFVEGHIRQYFRDKTWPCHVPRSVKNHAYRIKRTSDELGHDLSRQEIIEHGCAPEDKVDDALVACSAWNPASIYHESSCTELTHEAASASSCIDVELDNLTDQLSVQSAMSCALTPYEALVVRMHYFEDLSQREVADRLGTYQMHISRTLHRALGKLKHELEE